MLFISVLLYCGIHKQISILIVVQNRCISSWKNVIFFWKILFVKLNFQDEDQLYANRLIDILSLHRKCSLFQFLIGCTGMNIHILTVVQTWCIIRWKIVIFAGNSLFWSLIDKLEVNCVWTVNVFVIFWQSLTIWTKYDFSVGKNLVGQLSDITDQ